MRTSSRRLIVSEGGLHDHKHENARYHRVFYNDPKTISNHFTVTIANRGEAHDYVKPTLIFEDGRKVSDQSWLREIDPPQVYTPGGKTVAKFRIDQVSSKSGCSMKYKLAFTIGSSKEVTDPILVLAKNPIHERQRRAKKRAVNNQELQSAAPKKSKKVSRSSSSFHGSKSHGDSRKAARDAWEETACLLLMNSCWQQCGVEMAYTSANEIVPDPTKPIFRCVHCGHAPPSGSRAHAKGCPMTALLLQSSHAAGLGGTCGAPPQIKSEPQTDLPFDFDNFNDDPALGQVCPPSPARSQDALGLGMASLGAPPPLISRSASGQDCHELYGGKPLEGTSPDLQEAMDMLAS